jgi:hypothetical protein
VKEASGEANLTVITIILIGVIVAIATPLINNMMRNTARRTCCQNFGGVWNNGQCRSVNNDGSMGNQIAENQL